MLLGPFLGDDGYDGALQRTHVASLHEMMRWSLRAMRLPLPPAAPVNQFRLGDIDADSPQTAQDNRAN